MKSVLVSCHPYDKSFNAAIVNRVKSSQNLEHIDLAVNGFNPTLTAKELYEFSQARTERGVKAENLDPMAVQFARTINESEHLILVFPIWWELMPAQMKGFIDKVVFPGIFYEYKSEFTMRAVSKTLKKVTVITTMNTPKILYSLKFKNCVSYALMKGTFRKLGIKNVNWVNFGFIKKIGDARRKKLLDGLPGKVFG